MESNFSEKVNNIVKGIPQGKTMSYKEVATRAGNERGARVVARIMSKNFDPKIPCHRVICSNGKLGGYNRGGEPEKRRILQKEGYNGSLI